MKPIEPGCVCIIVASPTVLRQNVGRMVLVVEAVDPRNVGRMVLVVEAVDPRCVPPLFRLMLGNGGYWAISGVASALHTSEGPDMGQVIAHESYLRRLDDDPDAAEPRIAEREVEHV